MNKLSTSDSSSSSSSSNQNKEEGILSLPKTSNKNDDIQYLQKKISRNNFKEKNILDKKILNEKNELSLNTFPQRNVKKIKIKNITNEGKDQNHAQSLLNSSFENETLNNNKNFENSNNFLNNNKSKKENEGQKYGKSKIEDKKEIYKKMDIEQNEEINKYSENENNLDNNKNNSINDINNIIKSKDVNKINKDELNSKIDKNKNDDIQPHGENKISQINQNNIINTNSSLSETGTAKSSEEQNNKNHIDRNENFLILTNNFTEEEIELSKNIETEFCEFIKNTESETDKLIRSAMFFISKGFNEKIRYMLYKCLINYGYPFINKFNQFYNNFNAYCLNEKVKAPEKMYTEFYCEYILKMLTILKTTQGKNKYISEFFFNGENIEVIINNLNLIKDIKDNIDNNHYYLQNLLEQNFDILFKSMPNKINKDFSKAKPVFCKILSNIISRCDKSGYLNYKQLISSENVLFDGVKIKSQHNAKLNLKKMISIKLFGQEFGEKKFNTVLLDYFLHLFTIYKPIFNNK